MVLMDSALESLTPSVNAPLATTGGSSLMAAETWLICYQNKNNQLCIMYLDSGLSAILQILKLQNVFLKNKLKIKNYYYYFLEQSWIQCSTSRKSEEIYLFIFQKMFMEGVMWSVVKWYANKGSQHQLRGEGLAWGVDEKIRHANDDH